MLTQIQIPEPQAALLAACPRPRAATPSVLSLTVPSRSSVLTTAMPTPVVSMSARWFDGTRGFGAAAVERVERVERPAGHVAAGIVGTGVNGTSRNDQQDKQHKQYLTARRGPVTWRPPR